MSIYEFDINVHFPKNYLKPYVLKLFFHPSRERLQLPNSCQTAAGYITQCFAEAPLPAPCAPAEAVALEAVELGPVGAEWRRAAAVEEGQQLAMGREVEERVRREALEPWKVPEKWELDGKKKHEQKL